MKVVFSTRELDLLYTAVCCEISCLDEDSHWIVKTVYKELKEKIHNYLENEDGE